MDDGVVGGIRVDKARGRGSSTMVAGVFAERIPWRTFRIPHSAFCRATQDQHAWMGGQTMPVQSWMSPVVSMCQAIRKVGKQKRSL